MSHISAGNRERILQVISLSEKFPADLNLADAHYRAQWFAPEMFFRCPRCNTQFNQNVHICPQCGLNIQKEVYHCTCCRHKIKELQYDICINDSSVSLSPDIVVYFAFIKLVLVYFVFRFLVLDLYTIYTNWDMNTCRYLADKVNCPKTIITRLATLRRVENLHSLFIFDLVNLAFVVISILYFLCCENYLHTIYHNVANMIQTEDDYSIFVYNIPILMDNQQTKDYVGYQAALTSYFQQLITDWISRQSTNVKTQSTMFKDYVRLAQRLGDNPLHPRKIVTNINLCWDLEQLQNIKNQKTRIMWLYKRRAGSARAQQSYQYMGLDQETQNKLRALTEAQIDVSNKFMEKINSSDFVIGRFLGKAFVSFQYQHFAEAVNENIKENDKFESFKDIMVEKAAAPVDIHWNNLNISTLERTERKVTTFLLTIGCVILGFLIVLALRYTFKSYFKLDDYTKNEGLWILAGSVGVTTLIIVINNFTKWLVTSLTEYEEHETRTAEEESLLFKLILASFTNIVLSTLVVWKFMGVGVWDKNGLAVQVIAIMLIASIIEVFLSIINWRWIYRWLNLRLRYRTGQPILQFQFMYNLEYQLPRFNLAEQFNYYIWQSYFLSFYSYLVPASSIIGIFAIIMQYFLDRINLLRRSSFHPNYSFDLARSAIRLLETTVLVHAFGNFILGWIQKGQWYQPVNIISLIIALAFTIFIWGIIGGKRHACFYTVHAFQQTSYTQSRDQGRFFHSYISQNPTTRNFDFGHNEQKYYGLDNSKINNSFVMSPQPVIGSLPQIANPAYRSVI